MQGNNGFSKRSICGWKLVKDILLGINGDAVHMNFVVKVWRCATAGVAYQADLVSSVNLIASLYQVFLQVSIPRYFAVSMIYSNHFPETPIPAGKRDDTISRGDNWSAAPSRNVKAAVALSKAGKG